MSRASASGERLPATYANFLITNRTILVPVYGDSADAQALAALAAVSGERRVVPVNRRTPIEEFGSLHRLTMQLPQERFPMLKVALVQQSCSADAAANRAESNARFASPPLGGRLVVLQELHSGLYFCQTEGDPPVRPGRAARRPYPAAF